jgi:acyl-CoA synthetase (AMP-forming)/AMP-acid ligase II
MLGLMMQTPLLLSSILTHAARSFPDVEIVSRTPCKPDHITSYSGLFQRSSQLANALDSIGVKPGDRVATLAWNNYRGRRTVCRRASARSDRKILKTKLRELYGNHDSAAIGRIKTH